MFVQLETVYVLEGLGPPKDEAAAGRTFADQVLMPLIQPACKWQQGHLSEAHEHVNHECHLQCKGLRNMLLQRAQWALVAGTTAWAFGR